MEFEQATAPSGEKRWWVFLTDGTKRLTWKLTAEEARAAAIAKGLEVDCVAPAGSPLTDRGV